jgi:hypothetical protein
MKAIESKYNIMSFEKLKLTALNTVMIYYHGLIHLQKIQC